MKNCIIDESKLEKGKINFLKNFDLFDNIEIYEKDSAKAILYGIKEITKPINVFLGEIWTVDLCMSVGSEISGCRLCVIWDNSTEEEKNTVTILPITSTNTNLGTHVTITDEMLFESESGIKGDIKCEHIRSISKGRLGRMIGRLSNKGIKNVTRACFRHMGFNFLLTNVSELNDDDIRDINKYEKTTNVKKFIKKHEPINTIKESNNNNIIDIEKYEIEREKRKIMQEEIQKEKLRQIKLKIKEEKEKKKNKYLKRMKNSKIKNKKKK